MLDFMRRQRSKLKWLWVVIIVVFIVPLVVYLIPMGDLGAVNLSADVAEVGSETVSAREFQTSYTNWLRQMQTQGSQLDPEIRRTFGFDMQLLQQLIEQKVVAAEAGRLEMQVSSEELQKELLSNPAFLAGGVFIGQERYRAMLAQYQLTPEQFESSVRSQLLGQKLHSFITAGIHVSDREVEDEYRKRNEKVDLTYFVIDPAKLESKVTVTDQSARDYYEKNKARYRVNEKRRSKYILVETLKYRKEATASEEELAEYYAEHSEEYRLPEQLTAQHILFKTEGKTAEEVETIRKKATDVLNRARKGEDFAKLARTFSEDNSAKDGGNLGTITRGRMVPEFEQAAFSMGPGAISDLVTTQFGFHIIKVNEKQEGRLRPLPEMKEAIRPIILFRKGEEKARQVAETINVELATNKDLSAVAAGHGAVVQETPLLEQSQQVPDLGESAEYQSKVSAMTPGEIGIAIPVGRGFAIPQLIEKVDAHDASFEEARDRVTADEKSEKARELATENANKVQEQIKAGRTDLAALARSVGGETKTTGLILRGGSIADFGSLADRDDEMFSLPVGKPGTPATLGGKTLFFAVKARQEINRDEMAKATAALRAEILPAKRNRYFGEYIRETKKRMEENGEISINTSAVRQIADSIP
jgi:peptidyl-prolyl cis-trans isomerase D